jgi:hypothetical protein
LTPEAPVEHRDGHVAWAEHVARPMQHEAHLEPVYVGESPVRSSHERI